MKYLVVLLLGIIVGACLAAAAIVYNPLIGSQVLSPLTVTDSQTVSLSYSGSPSSTLVFTNDGLSRANPYPENVAQLWEKTIRQTELKSVVLRNARGQTAGLGVKFSSRSERTSLLDGKALVDSAWYVYLPGRGSLFIEQEENYWDYFREVVIPAYRSSANTWKGKWMGDITSGPGALQTSRVVGGAGEFSGAEFIGVESVTVQAWSVEDGPVSVDGRLVIELREHIDAEEEIQAN